MDRLKLLLDNFKARTAALTFNQRVVLGAVAMAAVISLVVFSVWLKQEEKAVLFTNLSAEDASAALQELSKQDVVAELTNGGTTILVPEQLVHRLRVDLAAKGVPSSGTVGFEIFDGKQYGLTEFLQNVNFKRALEGELTKTIESLQGVQSARVHLVLPKPSIFKKLAALPTASVVVRLGRNAHLSADQIAGIQSLIAGSVEGLDGENVTVLDQVGKVLSVAYQDDAVGRTEGQLGLKKEVEQYLTTKAESMLDEVLGAGRAIVRVDATLNFEKLDSESETFDPNATVIRSEERDESNDPETGGTQETSVTNYEINRTVQRIVGEIGGIKTLSVAVFVDGTYETDGEDEENPYTPLSEEDLGQIRRIVQTAVGLNTVRGDQIEVVNMQFQQRDPQAVGGAGPGWMEMGTQYGGRVVLLLILGVLLLSFRKNLNQVVGDVIGSLGQTPTGGDAEQETAADGETTSKSPQPRFSGMAEMDDTVIDDIREYADEHPDRVAEAIQLWVSDTDFSKVSH